MELLLKERIAERERILSFMSSTLMETYFYHIKWHPLNVTTHVRILCNGSYANDISAISAKHHFKNGI